MNLYTQLLNYFKALGEADTFVNTITQGDFTKIDLDKGQLHPLLHIQVNNGIFPSDSVIQFNVQIGCFDNRDINKEIVEDRFWKQDNEVDNLNETLATLNRLWLNMYRNFNNNNITATQASFEPFTMEYAKLLDGWIMTFDIEIPNNIVSLCDGTVIPIVTFSNTQLTFSNNNGNG
jgi:hypothetical protein